MRSNFNPKWQYCGCGYVFKPRTYHKILMLVFESYTVHCPVCHTEMKFKLFNHVVKVETKVNKEKEKVWRKG